MNMHIPNTYVHSVQHLLPRVHCIHSEVACTVLVDGPLSYHLNEQMNEYFNVYPQISLK